MPLLCDYVLVIVTPNFRDYVLVSVTPTSNLILHAVGTGMKN